MSKYRNFIGGFSINKNDRSSYYWSSALVNGNNHHCAMDFSINKDIKEDLISYAFLDVSFIHIDKFSIRPVK